MTAATAANRTPVLPDERFWKRYSPHHEFPLSTAASVALHLLGLGLMALVGYAIITFSVGEANRPVQTKAVALDEPSGGGGNPRGDGNAPGGGDLGTHDAVPRPSPSPDGPATSPMPKPEPFAKADRSSLKLDAIGDPATQRLIDEGGPQVDAWVNLTESTRKKLGNLPRKGDPGAGAPGGGDKPGPGKGAPATVRDKRVLRWTLIFNTRDGGDYARQLQALGAILAVPDPKNEDNYLVIRDLGDRPAKSKAEDVSQIKRIFWIDDKPSSVRSLANALGLSPTPRHIVAFFDTDLEEKLLRLELKFRGMKEDEITETRFDVFRSGGTYDVRVVSQR